MRTKIRPVKNGGFVELPKEWLERQSWKVGDELDAVDLSDGIKLVTGFKKSEPTRSQ